MMELLWKTGSAGNDLPPTPTSTSVSLVVGILCLSLLFVSVLNLGLSYSLHVLHIRRASGCSKVASETLSALRQAESAEYPAARHRWSVTSRSGANKLVPILCVECMDTIAPYGIARESTVRRCTRCGVGVHDGCLKHVKDACRGLDAVREGGGSGQPHYWLVSGTVFEDELVGGGRMGGAGGAQRPGAAQDAGSRRKSAATASTPASSTATAPVEDANADETTSDTLDTSDRCLYCKQRVARLQTPGYSRRLLPADPTWVCGHCGEVAHVACFVRCHESVPHLSTVTRAYRRALQRQGSVVDREGEGAGPSVAVLSELGKEDVCRIGSGCKLFALPSSCVRDRGIVASVAGGDGKGSGRGAKAPPGTMAGVGERKQGGGGSRDGGVVQMTRGNLKGLKIPGAGSSSSSSSSKRNKRKRAWWKRVFSSETLDWGRWEVLPHALPPKCRPVLVFINTKSGPQVGTILRDQVR